MRSDLIFDGLRKIFLWSDLIFFEELSFLIIASLSEGNFFFFFHFVLLQLHFFIPLSTSLLEIISILFCWIILSVVSVNCSFKLCSLIFISIFSTLRSDKLTIELEISLSIPAKVFRSFLSHQKSFPFLFIAVFHLEQYIVFFFALPHLEFVY